MSGKVLILDDEESIRFTFEEFLSGEGYQVATAATVDEAVELLQRCEIDLIFSDILIAGGDGIDFLETCRSRYAHIPVVMMTGFPTMDTATAALRFGAYDYVAKPVTQQVLLKTTRMALDFKRIRDEKRRYRAHLKAVFSSVKDCIITVDQQLRVVNFNDSSKIHPLFLWLKQGISIPADAPGGDLIKQALQQAVSRAESVEHKRLAFSNNGQGECIVTLTTTPLLTASGDTVGAVLVARDETRIHQLETCLEERRRFHGMIGASSAMQEIFVLLTKLADVTTSVLVTGESGTGKELVVDALHYQGPRKNGPLIKVNCSALSENLLESELFGHVKGAFTGAVRSHVGRFEAAAGGTIFLDEIGDISPRIQVKLLRVLQEKIIEKVGDSTPIPVDVRVVAATHQDLAEKIKQGTFREDLFYRLKVVKLILPPLRERRADIPLLIDHFIAQFNNRFSRRIRAVSSAVERILLTHQWPGNIRELEHVMEHAFVLCKEDLIELWDLPPELLGVSGGAVTPDENEAEVIIRALTKTGGNKTRAARLLNISRRTIYRKIAELNIETG